MTAFAEKLSAAGADTIGARLTTACTEAIRRHPDSVANAWRSVGEAFGHDFLRGLMGDMQPAPKPESMRGSKRLLDLIDVQVGKPAVAGVSMPAVEPKPYQPRIVTPERLEKRRELQQIIRSKFKNSAGVAWSDVGWHELHALRRDGNEARALLAHAPAHVPNTGCTVGDVLGVAQTDRIIEASRR